MTGAEWLRVADEIEALWGRTGKWAKADEAYKYAQRIPAKAAFAAVEEIYLEERPTAPPPAEILARAKKKVEHVTTTDEIRRYCRAEGHLLAIVEETGGVRTTVCARCGEEETRAAHLVPTEGEIEDGVASGRPDGDLAERIAP